jgi:hypothetical protein
MQNSAFEANVFGDDFAAAWKTKHTATCKGRNQGSQQTKIADS